MSTATIMKDENKIEPSFGMPFIVGFSSPGDSDGPMVYLNDNLVDPKQIKWMERAVRNLSKTSKKRIDAYNLSVMQQMHHEEGWPLKEIEELAKEYGITFKPRV